MLPLEEARGTILAHVTPLGTERVPLLDSAGRVLAEDSISPWDMPPWDNAAMDGYAVRWEDCGTIPRTLRVSGFLPAGAPPDGPGLEPGCAIRIMTGAPLPAGCDAVVPLEHTDDGRETVTLLKPVERGQHLRRRGSEAVAGSTVALAGTPVGPALVGRLAGCGLAMVAVHRSPCVAILTSGDELIEPGRSPGPGEIINGNSLALAAAVREAGGVPRIIGIARDTRESHRSLLAEGLKADALITSAGVAGGDHDFVRETLAELGCRQLFWKVAMRPGGPSAFALHDSTPVFCLPGTPRATLIAFEELVRPALLRMQGHGPVRRPLFRAVLRDELRGRPDLLQLVPVRLEREGERWYASGDRGGMTGMEALALLPAGTGCLAAEDEVEVHFCGNRIDLV